MSSLNNRLGRVEAQTCAANLVTSDRPTANELWMYKLEEVTQRLVEYHHDEPAESKEYDSACMYAHRDCLKSEADARAAPDRVLFEAMGLDGGTWGWLQFMIREINFYSLLAANWGLPAICGDYGGGGVPQSKSPERWAMAAFYFCDFMKRERGVDVLARLREEACAGLGKDKHTDAEIAEFYRGRHEWAHIVCSSASLLKPELMSEPGEVGYTGAFHVEFLGRIRDAASQRRSCWDATHACAVEPVAGD
jgi:hypothetical protein